MCQAAPVGLTVRPRMRSSRTLAGSSFGSWGTSLPAKARARIALPKAVGALQVRHKSCLKLDPDREPTLDLGDDASLLGEGRDTRYFELVEAQLRCRHVVLRHLRCACSPQSFSARSSDIGKYRPIRHAAGKRSCSGVRARTGDVRVLAPRSLTNMTPLWVSSTISALGE